MATITDPELHYFSVDFAIELGLDKSRQLVWFHSDEHSCQSLGLEPVFMYWITAPGYSRRFRLLVDPRKPIAMSNFLAQAWSEEGEMAGRSGRVKAMIERRAGSWVSTPQHLEKEGTAWQ